MAFENVDTARATVVVEAVQPRRSCLETDFEIGYFRRAHLCAGSEGCGQERTVIVPQQSSIGWFGPASACSASNHLPWSLSLRPFPYTKTKLLIASCKG